MRLAPFLAIAALSLWPALTRAAETPEHMLNSSDFTLKTAEDLYRVCSVAPDDPLHPQAINFCQGFLLGVVSYHDAVTDKQHLKRLICYPQTATRDQGIQAFIAWGAAHQKDHKFMNEPAVYGAVRGLASKWPCK
jgi:Rap1a immunity proteins